jgi:hypothetical protein
VLIASFIQAARVLKHLCITGLLRDMLTGEMLPASTVIASHLYKSEWRDLAKAELGIEDIDDVGNGLLLWKPIEYAFDTSALCFVYDKGTDRCVCNQHQSVWNLVQDCVVSQWLKLLEYFSPQWVKLP